VPSELKRAFNLYRSSIGKKLGMAVTGALLFGFVIVHMVGNLKIYQGPEKYNAYAQFLREAGYPLLGHGQMLWLFRLALIASVALHIVAAAETTRISRRARSTRYRRRHDLSFSYASRTMRWGGVIVAGFVVYHLLHLTLGSVHPDFVHDSVYHNVVAGFRVWPVSLAYILCMLPLGLHIYHGLWSATQTLGVEWPWLVRWRRPAAAAAALVIVLGNISIPLAVLAGVVGE
jgi:succinate dehydrogenase / fumarate reductase cytochrome b subunit